MLYNKWWKDTGDVCSRDEKKKDSKASPLGIANIGQSAPLCGTLGNNSLGPTPGDTLRKRHRDWTSHSVA